MTVSFDDFIVFAREFGIAWAFLLMFLYAIWRLIWYIIKETIPKSMFDELNDIKNEDIATAIKANTSSIEILSLKLDERIPKGGDR